MLRNLGAALTKNFSGVAPLTYVLPDFEAKRAVIGHCWLVCLPLVLRFLASAGELKIGQAAPHKHALLRLLRAVGSLHLIMFRH